MVTISNFLGICYCYFLSVGIWAYFYKVTDSLNQMNYCFIVNCARCISILKIASQSSKSKFILNGGNFCFNFMRTCCACFLFLILYTAILTIICFLSFFCGSNPPCIPNRVFNPASTPIVFGS